jgi:hypothetical protein
LQNREIQIAVKPKCPGTSLAILECIHSPECTVIPFEEFSSDVPGAVPSTLPYLIARIVDDVMHDFRIEPEDDDLWMLELLIEAERICETRPIRVPHDHVHKPPMLFPSLKNALIVIA